VSCSTTTSSPTSQRSLIPGATIMETMPRNTCTFTHALDRGGFVARSHVSRSARVWSSIARCSAFFVIFSLIASSSTANAKLVHASCVGNNCIQSSRNGSLCYYPDTTDRPLLGRCTSQPLSDLVEVHIAAGDSDEIPTIAYYNIETGSFLGNSAWSVYSWPQGLNAGLIALCSTGHLHGDTFQSTCRFARDDEDFGKAEVHLQECTRVHGHDERIIREMCCGPPRSVCPTSKHKNSRRNGGLIRWFYAVATVSSTISAIIWTRSERVRNPRD